MSTEGDRERKGAVRPAGFATWRGPGWHHHPAVRTGQQLTRGERAADTLRNRMGSWGFVIGALLFLAGWTIGNRGSGFDPYPFILLNLLLSCLAALQGAILLIAARRSDQIASELALHDFQTDVHGVELLARLDTMITEMHARTPGVDHLPDDRPDLNATT